MLAAVGAILLSGCTGGTEPEPPPPPNPTPSQAPAVSPDTAPSLPAVAEPIEFAFQPPDPVCPPVSALSTLPLADEHPYESVDPYLSDVTVERFGHHAAYCRYERVNQADRDEDRVLDDHVLLSSQLTLYRRWEDSIYRTVYPELPVGSEDPRDWQVAGPINDRGVWWEGCGPTASCEDGEDPTVRTYASELRYQCHVGNLELYGRVIYVSQWPPADVESRIRAVFREFVLATIESYERIG